jgi:RNA polymerase sigma-70 factor (ECF subfamily)
MGGQGIDEDFTQAFDDLFPRARRLAQRIVGNPTAAEDIAAEALARAYLRWHRLGGLAHRDGWVLRVASNLAIDSIRARGRGHTAAQAAPQAAPASEDDLAVLRVALAAALKSLSRRQREVIVLRYLAGMTETAAAECLGVSPATVGTYLRRGRAAMQARLGDDFRDMEITI